jgi:5-methylcytosine-specific restriction endonuclease McrA
VKVIVLVDHAALLRGRTVAGETCEIAGLGPISVETARQILLDDPFLAVVVKRGRDVVNVAHQGRGLNAHQRTAIEANGVRCSNIACNRTVAIQIDHRHPYVADPVTELRNQDPLCPECHRKKTHHGWHLEPGTGRRRLVSAGDPTRPTAPDSAPTETRATGGHAGAEAEAEADAGAEAGPEAGADRGARAGAGAGARAGARGRSRAAGEAMSGRELSLF